MNFLDSLSGDTENFFKFLGLAVFLCFMIYVICQVISFNYSFVEGMIGEKPDHIADIIKKGGDGGRVGLDQDKITKRLEEDRTLLNRTDLINDIDRSLMPLLDKHSENNKIGFVIVTGDRGLAGSFNTNIIKKAEKEIAKAGKENAKLFCIGKKGY